MFTNKVNTSFVNILVLFITAVTNNGGLKYGSFEELLVICYRHDIHEYSALILPVYVTASIILGIMSFLIHR